MQVSNPASNAFGITSVTFIAPTGWNFTTGVNGPLTTSSVGTATSTTTTTGPSTSTVTSTTGTTTITTSTTYDTTIVTTTATFTSTSTYTSTISGTTTTTITTTTTTTTTGTSTDTTSTKYGTTTSVTTSYSTTVVTTTSTSTSTITTTSTGPGALATAWCLSAGYGFQIATVSSTVIQCVAQAPGLPPGFSATFSSPGTVYIQGPESPATAPPVTGVFTTSVADASGSGQYTGPSWTETSIAGSGTLVSPAHTGEIAPTITVAGNTASYTAGAAPQTVTATLTLPTQPGVPLTFSASNLLYPTTGFTTTFTPTSSTTGATDVLSTIWQPSNHAGDTTQVTATITGSDAAQMFFGTSSTSTMTVAGAPTSVTFYLPSTPTLFPSTHYLEGATAYTVIGGVLYANIAGPGAITYAATDAFGNAVTSTITGGSLTASNGFFAATPAETSCTVKGTCGNLGVVPQYSQSEAYGTIGQIDATLTGTGFSVSGQTGFIQTSTFATSALFTLPTGAASVGAGTTLSPKVQLASTGGLYQTGVPVTLEVCVHSACAATSKGYSGTFTGDGLSYITGMTNATGSFGSPFAVSTKLGAVVVLNASIAAPIDTPPPTHFYSSLSPAITTIAGPPSALAVYATYFNSQLTGGSGKTAVDGTASATLYVDAVLTDAYGNVVPNPTSTQIQVNFALSGVGSPAGGLLTASSAYIATNCPNTNQTIVTTSVLTGLTCYGSFGPVAWTLPSVLGANTVTASAVVAGKEVVGSRTVTVISPLPTINVKSPAPVGGVIYSSSPLITFSGKANASLGYPSSIIPVTIASVGYKLSTNAHWQSVIITPANKIVWSVPLDVPTGLSTIEFNATDSNVPANVGFTSTYQVLVDPSAPTFTFASPTTVTGCIAVTVTSAEGDFNEGSFAATYGGVAVPSANIAWSGTQTLGASSSVTATICGLTAGTATLAVSGSTYALVSGSNSETLTVTVSFADSITFATSSATYGTVGAYTGITISVTNSWSTAQTIVVYATFKSGTTPPVTYVAQGTETLSPGQTASVFCIDLIPIPAGTYSVTFSAVTTSNLAVSAPTTAITVVVP